MQSRLPGKLVTLTLMQSRYSRRNKTHRIWDTGTLDTNVETIEVDDGDSENQLPNVSRNTI
jgi:hypothetical protein